MVFFIYKLYVYELTNLNHCLSKLLDVCWFVFRKTGTAYIRKVFQHNTPEGFLSSVIAELIDPFGIEEVNESSCLSSSLSISEAGNHSYKLSLQLQSKCDDISDGWER